MKRLTRKFAPLVFGILVALPFAQLAIAKDQSWSNTLVTNEEVVASVASGTGTGDDPWCCVLHSGG